MEEGGELTRLRVVRLACVCFNMLNGAVLTGIANSIFHGNRYDILNKIAVVPQKLFFTFSNK